MVHAFRQSAWWNWLTKTRAAREVEFEIVHAPLSRPMEQLGHFHAKWHRDVFPVSRRPLSRLDVAAKRKAGGRFCGVMLHVWNPTGGWWGEGDEKFFVDGEKYPSTFGTGSEDYFGFAYGTPLHFARPYQQTVCTPMPFLKWAAGNTSLVRWQIVDSVPFQKSFEGCIEKYSPPLQYATTVYWYLSPDGTDPHEPVPVGRRTVGIDRPYAPDAKLP